MHDPGTDDHPGANATESLDPRDWEAMRRLAHRMIDDAFADVRSLDERPVWRPMPDGHRARFEGPMPREPEGAEAAYDAYRADVAPYPMGNDHPRFWAFYMGNGTVLGALSEFLAAMNASNLGGGSHAAAEVEAQVIAWCREMVGFPAEASGLVTSGASMANLIGLAVARNTLAGVDVRADGVVALDAPLVVYGSRELHSCHQRALELMGLGSRALRRIPVDDAYRIDLAALEVAIDEDRAAGARPLAVVANAGTINTGAVDDMDALADLCDRERLWFHVDAAIGAPVRLAPSLAGLMDGIERADSVALDLHKWMHAPFEAGMVLVRDEAAHRHTFTVTPEYLQRTARGLAGSRAWFSDYGPQLTRGFKALKVWMSLKEHGADRFGRLIERNVAQARRLADRIDASAAMERMAPVVLDIVCFRARPDGVGDDDLNAFNGELLLRLNEDGDALPSYTTLEGRYCLRVAICNHRTTEADLGRFLSTTSRLVDELVAHPGAWRGAPTAAAPEA